MIGPATGINLPFLGLTGGGGMPSNWRFQLVSQCPFCRHTALHYILELRRPSWREPHHGAVRECLGCELRWFELL